MRAFEKRWSFLAILLIVLASWITAAQSRRAANVDDKALRNAGKTGEEWITHGINYAEQRFSPLKQIDSTKPADVLRDSGGVLPLRRRIPHMLEELLTGEHLSR